MSEIWEVILISLIVLVLVLFLVGLVRLLVLLRLVLFLQGFGKSGWYLLAVLHAVEASYVSSSSTSAFRAAIVRSFWSSKMPLANAPAILGLLDGLVDVDPAFYVVWSRFRMMRRYLVYCLEEEPRVFRMLDLISGAQGHGGPVHLLPSVLLRLVLWDGGEKGRFLGC